MANMAKYNARVVQKHDTKANWDKATNFVPLPGEIIVYDDLDRIKIGDGVTTVVNLPFSIPTKEEVGLGNVDNTSDADKPVSSAQSAAIQEAIETARTTVKELDLQWGGEAKKNSVSPMGAALSAEHSANRLAYLNPNALAFEYSDDGGSSWTAMDVTDSIKIGFVTTSCRIDIGNASPVTTNHRTRVTLAAQDGTTNYVYTRPRKLLLNVGSAFHGISVIIETKTGANEASWSTVGIYELSGWNGWNDIPLSLNTLGGDITQPSNIWYMRFTFATTSVYSKNAAIKSAILGMRLFGDECWTKTSNMGETGHLYAYDTEQNATFPANVTASSFIGELFGNASSATKAAQDGNGNIITETYYNKTEIDNMELITVDDIDAICETTIQIASSEGVTF